MALELRPNCECCDKYLPVDAMDAMICTYECTFCKTCVDEVLSNACPNCGGGFSSRPIRPAKDWRKGVSRQHQPPFEKRRSLNYEMDDIRALSERLKNVPPEDR